MKLLRKRLAPAFLALVLCLSLAPAALAETVSTTAAGDSVILEGERSDVTVSGGGTITVAPGQEIAPGGGYITVPGTPDPAPGPSIYDGVTDIPSRPESCYITFFVRPGLFYDVYKTSVTIEAKWSGSGYRLTSLPSTPSLEGSLFNGWVLDGKTIDDIGSYDFQGNATVTAAWKSDIPSYSITFDANGGAFRDSSTSTVVKTNLSDGRNHVLPPSEPYRSGYIFYKWDPIEDPFNYNFTGDTTIKALWGYPVTFFDRDGRQTGTYATAPSGKLDSLPEPAAYPSHTFLGWSTSETSDSPDLIVGKDHVFTGETKLYPKWTLSSDLTVTLNPNGGSVTPTSVKIGSDGKLAGALPTPTRSGYTFAGWFVGIEQIKQDSVYSGPATLTARWNRSSKLSPAVTASPSSVKSGSGKVEITLSCAADETALDWRPLERIVTGSPANLETAVKNYIAGNFSAAGLKLTGIRYAEPCDCNYNAYFQLRYPDGVFPVRKLILTFEGAAKAGTMDIELGSGVFAAVMPRYQSGTVDQSGADLFNPARVSVLIGDDVSAQAGQTAPAVTVSFTDVASTSPFASAISWAVRNQITNGTGDGSTFSPSVTCTRAHILTFLWRSQGSPEPTIANPYKDSIPAAFQKAAVWAYEKGLVSGDEFGAAAPCTRESSVTYMWKLAGSPKAKASSFKDVAAGAAYAQAIDWAVEQGVTNGTGDGSTFSPGATCTRGQIVTFLFRAYAEKS